MLGRKGKGLFMPLRVALTGRSSGPEIPAQLQVLALAPGAVSHGVANPYLTLTLSLTRTLALP